MNTPNEQNIRDERPRSPREMLIDIFELRPAELPISGGWGCDIHDPCIIDRRHPDADQTLAFDGRKVEWTFIEKSIYYDLIASRPLGEGFASIGWSQKDQEIIRRGNRVFDKLAIEITALRETDFEELKAEWEGSDGIVSPDFDAEAHFVRREQLTLHDHREFWFDITNCETLELFGISFPWMLGRFTRGGVTSHELKESGLGYSVSYKSPEGTATIYIYDFNLENVPTELSDPIVADHFEIILSDVTRTGGSLLSQEVRLLSQEVRPKVQVARDAGDVGVQFLCGRFYMKTNDGEIKESFAFLTTFDGRFIKIRLTGPEHELFAELAYSFADAVAGVLRPEVAPLS